MRAWFESLAKRERIVLAIGVLFVLASLLYAGIIAPVSRASDTREARVSEKRAVLAELGQVAARIGVSTMPDSGAPGSSGQSIVVVIDRTTRNLGLGPYLKRNQPDGATSVRIRFEEAPFDDIVGWLANVQQSHGMRVTSASFDKSGATGRVNASLVLDRSPG